MIQMLKILAPKMGVMVVTYELSVIYFCIYIESWNKVYTRIRTATFDADAYRPCNVKVFMAT